MKNIYIETYGCAANQNNSEILAGLLTQSGNNITNNEKIADIIILNTCIVKGKTENKIKRRIQDVSKIYPQKLMIITGCMPETDFEQLKKLNPKAIFLGTNHFKDIINILKDHQTSNIKSKQKNYLSSEREIKLNTPKIPQNKLISIIQISEGCLGECVYCKTRLAKGKLFSYPEELILKSIESDLQNHAKEVWLTSQDLSSYGLDQKNIKKSQLPKLLTKILALKYKFKLRLGMMNPNTLYPILNEIIEIYKNPKIYKFIHLPVQSASDKILKHMKRKYKIEKPINIIQKIRQQIPNITLATDIIIGYPTETKSDFNQSLDFIKTYKPDVFNLSKLSLHKGTKLYQDILNKRLKPLPQSTINKRTTKIMQEHRKTALENKKKFLNKTTKVFINKKLSNNLYEARDNYYNIVLINPKDNLLGKNVGIRIKSIGVHQMIGEII